MCDQPSTGSWFPWNSVGEQCHVNREEWLTHSRKLHDSSLRAFESGVCTSLSNNQHSHRSHKAETPPRSNALYALPTFLTVWFATPGVGAEITAG